MLGGVFGWEGLAASALRVGVSKEEAVSLLLLLVDWTDAGGELVLSLLLVGSLGVFFPSSTE